MVDHSHVINRLTEEQKIRLLTDIHSLADPELSALGIPLIRCEAIQNARGDVCPSAAVLARSWDKALISDVAEAQGEWLLKQGFNHLLLPEAKVKTTPYGNGFSEDPVLAGELAGAYLAGVNRVGIPASLSGYGFAAKEAAELDSPPTSDQMYRFLELPYLRALRGGICDGLVLDAPADGLPEASYGRVLVRHAQGQETVTAIAKGQICLQGSASALQSALHNFRRVRTAIEHGRATTGELEALCSCGEAISEETLDAAVDRLLSFAEDCASRADAEKQPIDTANLADRVARASVILLENRGTKKSNRPILPLRSGTSVCLIGDVIRAGGQTFQTAANIFAAAGYSVPGYARGYDLAGNRSEGLLKEALLQARRAAVTVLFMGIDNRRARRMEKEGRITLPANQLALFDELTRLGISVITVISCDLTPDLSFVPSAVQETSALLWAPLDMPEGLSAVADTLNGTNNPSGRLPVTLCAHEDTNERSRRCGRVGPFVGYRYYDTVGYGALYPFGYGLSYSSFRYSMLRVHKGQISFTVKNIGRQSGIETVQVYLGLRSSEIVRPKKELIAFSRLELAPGQETKVTLRLEILPWRAKDGRLLTERGTYELSIGASVTDIRLHMVLKEGEDTVDSDGSRPEDYLPSVSNIQSQHYVMEAEYTPMKPYLRNLLFGIAALCLAVSLKIYDILTAADSGFLDMIAGILAIGSAAFFAMEIMDRRKQHMEERDRIEKANAASFADASFIPIPSAAELFAAEDDWYRIHEEAEGGNENGDENEAYDHFADVDKELTFPRAVHELTILAREKGMTVSDSTVRSLFTALAASRLLVVRGLSEAHFAALISLLSEYFDGSAEIDEVDETYRSEADALFATDEHGNCIPRGVLNAIQNAQAEPGKIHLAAFTQVEPETMSAYFVPFARHAHAPYSGCMVACHGPSGEENKYRISENLWFIVNLKQDASLCALPDYISEIATVHAWTWETKGYTAEGHTEFRHFSFGQMEYLCDRIRSDFTVDEETWKQIDRLEAYGARYSDFRIGNKTWLGMELYMAVLISLGADEPTARDEALSVKLMPTLLKALSGRIPRGERGLGETLDAIFGEEHTALCRKTMKESNADLI